MIRHHIVDERDLKEDFNDTADQVRELKGVSNDTKLEFYGLYKQSTCGPCQAEKPGVFDLTGRAKYDAWEQLGDLSKSDAMLMYIDLHNSLDEGDLKYNEKEDGPMRLSTLYIPEADVAESSGDIWHACRHGDLGKVRECFTTEVASQRDGEGRTLLHWAVDRGHLELAQFLIEKACDLNSKDEDGSTPLHYAAICEHKEILQLLLNKGARWDIKDGEGITAVEMCENGNLKECFDKLKVS